MKETANDYLFRSLKWLGGVFAVTVGILAGADQLMKLGWPVEWYVIAFLSVGIIMLAILLVYFYKQMRKFDLRSRDVIGEVTDRSLEQILTRKFVLEDRVQHEVARMPLEKGQEIKVNMRTSDKTRLTIMTTGFPREKLGNPEIVGPYSQVFTIPENGDWVVILNDDRGIPWEGFLDPKKKPPRITGNIDVYKVKVTRASPHPEPF